MELNLAQNNDSARFTIVGDIDQEGAENLKQRFKQLDLSSLKEVTFDFNKVSHIGSAGLGKFLLFYKDTAIHRGTIRLENTSKEIYDLLKSMKLDTIFTITRA